MATSSDPLALSSGNTSTSVNLLQSQRDYLDALTKAATGTFLPTYQNTVGGAQSLYSLLAPFQNQAALTGYNQSNNVASSLIPGSLGALSSAKSTLENVISPDYIKNQLAAAIQPIQEQNREMQGAQTAMYGATGNLGSARAALADRNLSSLNQQRQSQAVANAIANITGQQINASGTLGTLGLGGVTQGQNATTSAQNFAQAPMDAYAKFANIIFGTPQASTVPNYSGTQATQQSTSGTNTNLGSLLGSVLLSGSDPTGGALGGSSGGSSSNSLFSSLAKSLGLNNLFGSSGGGDLISELTSFGVF
jgi:hypothetical protein